MIYPELHVLHLPERIDREELYLREFAEQGITSYRIWDGIVNEQIPFAGISAAHKRIVRYAKQNNLPFIIIAEDDLKFTSKTSFEYFLKNIPDDYDIYLASIYMGIIKEDNTVDDFSGLTLYMVHERYYQKFLDTDPINHIDRAQAEHSAENPAVRVPRGRFVVCNPFAAIQHHTFSDNHKSVQDNSVWLQGRVLYNGINTRK